AGWLVDRPSKRWCRRPDAAKSSLRDPRRVGGKAIQAPGGRRRRPGRAPFAPPALGQRPPGASLDALLLLRTKPPAASPRRGWRRSVRTSVRAMGGIGALHLA